MDNKEDLIRKIEKIERLIKGNPSQNEMNNAMMMLQSLQLRLISLTGHAQIAKDEVMRQNYPSTEFAVRKTESTRDRIKLKIFPLHNGYSFLIEVLSRILQDHFFVLTAFGNNPGENVYREIKIYGEHHNVDIAAVVYISLGKQFQGLWSRHQAATFCNKADYPAYINGLAEGLDERLRLARQSYQNDTRALAKSNEVFEHIRQNIFSKDFVSSNLSEEQMFNLNRSLYNKGRQDSSQISLFGKDTNSRTAKPVANNLLPFPGQPKNPSTARIPSQRTAAPVATKLALSERLALTSNRLKKRFLG